MKSGTSLYCLSWLNAAAHAAALPATLIFLKPGSALAPLESRMAYLASEPLGWTSGWMLWMLCAILLAAWFCLAAHRAPARAAVALVMAGLGADLMCDVIQISTLPRAASVGDTHLFLHLERLAFTGGASGANGFYTAGVFLMQRALERAHRASSAIQFLAYVTVAGGALMFLSGLIPSPKLLAVATAPTVIGFCAWSVAAARAMKSGAPD